MTGFGGGTASAEGLLVTCEIRSVNGKGLELRMRLPGRLDRLEPDFRKLAKAALGRGNVQVAVSAERAETTGGVRIDHDALDRAVASAREAAERHGLAMPDLGVFLGMRGVMEFEDAPDVEDAEAEAARSAFAQALAALQSDREREGEAIATVLRQRLDLIAELTERAAADPSREPVAIRARLAERVAQLGSSDATDDDRLHAEVAMLCLRADVAEELDRLRADVAAARELLTADGPVGRRLEFLVQEFAREANTLCSKSNAVTTTTIGLDLKIAVDQMREQIANVE